MRRIHRILTGIAILALLPAALAGQSRIDSLLHILDTHTLDDTTYVRNSTELCRILVGTEQEYLISTYAGKALKFDTLGVDYRSKFILNEILGNYSWKVGNLDEAAASFNRMRLLGETHADTNILSNSYNGLGTVYYQGQDYAQALSYYRKGLAISGNDTLLSVRFYNNIANSFNELGQMDSVLPYYRKCLAYHLARNNYRFLSITCSNMALTNKKLGNIVEMNNDVNRALEYARLAGDSYQMISVYLTMGYLSIDENRLKSAEMYKKALSLATKIHSTDQIRECYEYLAFIGEAENNYKETVGYLTRLKEINDSVVQRKDKSRLKQMEFEHIAAIRNLEEIRMNQATELALLRKEQSRRVAIIILVGVIAAFLLLFLLGFQQYWVRMKITRTKERLFSILAHDIRNPFSGILGIAEILDDEAASSGDPNRIKTVSALNHSLNHVYELLENILQWSQSESGKLVFNPSTGELHPVVEEVIHLNSLNSAKKEILVENRIDSGLTARFDSNMLQTVLRNLVSNAIKFSSPGSRIEIAALQKTDGVEILVKDEGQGMTADQVDALLSVNSRFTTKGTRNEPGTGLGMMLCKDFIHRHGGSLQIESRPAAGTTVIVTLPAKPPVRSRLFFGSR